MTSSSTSPGRPSGTPTDDETFGARHESTLTAVAIGTGVLALITVLWLAAVAVVPSWRTRFAPTWLQWFGEPGNDAAAIILGVLLGATLGLRWLPHRSWRPGTTTLALAALSAATLVLSLSAFSHCTTDNKSPLLNTVYQSLLLFVGGDGDPLAVCTESFSVALDVARILALVVLLVTAIAAGIKLFRSQADRIAIRFGGELTIVVGVETDILPMIRAISRTTEVGNQLLVITSNADRDCVRAARDLGARVFELNLTEKHNLGALKVWHRARRIYLLSDDPQLNFTRFDEIDAAVRAEPSIDQGRRIPLILRIDDPWHAEHWRRQPMTGRRERWAPDAVGRYDYTAARLVRHMLQGRQDLSQSTALRRVYIGCDAPLTYAILAEFAQLERERRLGRSLYENLKAHNERTIEDPALRPTLAVPADPPAPEIVVLGANAASLHRDHVERQKHHRHADGDVLDFRLDSTVTSIDDVDALLGREIRPTEEGDPTRPSPHEIAVILERSTSEALTDGTRLAARFPEVPLYVGGGSVGLFSESPVVGRLINFPLTLDIDTGTPQDLWERAAMLKHKLYCIDQNPAKPSAKPWPELDEFFKGSNRREILNTLSRVEDADCTWSSSGAPVGVQPLREVAVDESFEGCIDKARTVGIDESRFREIIEKEHESWLAYHEKHGWQLGDVGGSGVTRKVREFEKKRSLDLVPWATYVQRGPANIGYSAHSLLRALLVLGVLGFRSMPRWRECERRSDGLARLTRLTEDFEWVDDHGVAKTGRAGDWRVDAPDGRTWTIVDSARQTSYEVVDEDTGLYRRVGTVEVRRAVPGEEITSIESDPAVPDIAEEGDFILRSETGGTWRISAEGLRAGYADPR